MNPRAGPECISFIPALTFACYGRICLLRIVKLWRFRGRGVYYAEHRYWNPKLRVSGPRLDAEVMVRESFPTYYGILYKKIDAEIRT